MDLEYKVEGQFGSSRLNSNPYFETDTSGYTAYGGTLTRSSAQSHTGSYSGLLTPSGAANLNYAESDKGAVVPFEQYRARGWFYSATGTSSTTYQENTLEGGTNGTTVTGFTTVIPGTGTVLHSTAQAMHGTVSAAFTAGVGSNCYVRWSSTVTAATFSTRLYIRMTAFPTASQILINAQTAAGLAVARLDISTTGLLSLVNTAGTAVASTTVPMTLNTWQRIAFRGNLTSGDLAVSLYTGDSLTLVDSTTATTTLGANGNPNRVQYGKVSNTGDWAVFYMDDVAQEIGTFTEISTPVVPATSSQASCSINWFTGADAYLSTSSNMLSLPPGQWTYLDNTFTAPAGAGKAAIVPTQLAVASQFETAVLADSPVAYWKLNETSADTHPVLSGYYNEPVSFPAGLDDYEAVIGERPNIVMWYVSWNTSFQLDRATMVDARGQIPMISWMPDQGTSTNANIIAGVWDTYIDAYAAAVKSYGKPVWIRLGFEMNGSWFQWGNTSFIGMWNHVQDRFTAQGVTNVKWVWSPNVVDPSYIPLADVFPGNSRVDIVGADGYNWGNPAPAGHTSAWKTFSEVFDATFREIRALAPDKPLWVTETASAEAGGSKATWITDMFVQVKNYGLEGFIWFNANKETDWRVNSSTAANNAFNAGSPVQVTKANDSISVHDGTYTGNPSLGTAALVSGGSGSVTFNNATVQSVIVPSVPVLNPGSVSVEAVIQATSWNGNNRIVQKGTTDNQYRLLHESGVLKFDVSGHATVTATALNTSKHHVVGTYDSATGTAKLYVDGTQVGTVTGTTGAAVSTTDPFVIGQKPDGVLNTNGFNGVIDEVVVYNYVLTPTQVSTHNTASNSTPAPTGNIQPSQLLYLDEIQLDSTEAGWVDLSDRLTESMSITRGRGTEFDVVGPGRMTCEIENEDGALTPGNTASPYYPNVKRGVPIRVTATLTDQNQPSFSYSSRRFTGFIYEWPVTWPKGLRAISRLSAADNFRRVGQRSQLRSFLVEECLLDNPVSFLQLNETESATAPGNLGTHPESGKVLLRGAGGTYSFSAGTGPPADGSSALILTPASSTVGYFIRVPSLITNASAVTLECWVATTDVSSTILDLSNSQVGQTFTGQVTPTISLNATGEVIANSDGTLLATGNDINDGATHHIVLVYEHTGTQHRMTLYTDGVQRASVTSSSTVVGISRQYLLIGGTPKLPVYSGTISNVALYDSALTLPRIRAHYFAGMTGFAGERSDQRVSRFASYTGLASLTEDTVTDNAWNVDQDALGSATFVARSDLSLQLGQSLVYGQSKGGANLLDEMLAVGRSEGGIVFASRTDGSLTFLNRDHRYNKAKGLTLDAGEDTIGIDLEFSVDDQDFANEIVATLANEQRIRVINQESIDRVGHAAEETTLLFNDIEDAYQAASWILTRKSSETPKIRRVSISLYQLPDQYYRQMLDMDISTLFELLSLPGGAPGGAAKLFVEGYTEQVTADSVVFQLNASAADDYAVWVLESKSLGVLGSTTQISW